MRTKRSIKEWISFAILLPFITFASFLVHELAHYATGEALGYDSWFNLNYAGFNTEARPSAFEQSLITLAGPAVTVLQAVIAALLIRSRTQLWLYGIVVAAFYMRATAFAISMMVYPNDEARISMLMGLPIWVLPSIVVASLLGLTIWAAYKVRAGLIANIIAYITCSATVAAIVLGSQAFPIRLG